VEEYIDIPASMCGERLPYLSLLYEAAENTSKIGTDGWNAFTELLQPKLMAFG